MRAVVAAAAAISLVAVGVTQAATVTQVQGNLFVSSGDGYAPAKAGISLVPGDRAVVSNNGRAVVRFDDGCLFELVPGKVLNVQKVSPCLDPTRVTERKADIPGRMNQSGPALLGGLPAGAAGTAGAVAGVVGGVAVGAVIGNTLAQQQQKKSP